MTTTPAQTRTDHTANALHRCQDGASGAQSARPSSSPPRTLEEALTAFVSSLAGRNLSGHTIRAYQTDVAQFISWIRANNVVLTRPDQVSKLDLRAYLATLGQRDLSGVSRGRKLAALREYFRFLVGQEWLATSPATGVETPKKEKNGRVWLRPDEYSRLLSLAGANPRDYAVLQVFLQTGLRVSELCDLRLVDVDLIGRSITVTGKGRKMRTIELEKKALQALKNYLATRPAIPDDHLFLNYKGDAISERGIRKLVTKYRVAAGITKKASCHSLRHTFATYKAEQGVSAFWLKERLGHERLDTTQLYVHEAGRKNARKVMEATSL